MLNDNKKVPLEASQELLSEGQREKQILKDLKDKNNWFNDLLKSHVKTSGTLQALVDVIPAGVLVTDATGNITFANTAAAEILGSKALSNVFESRDGYTLNLLDGQPFPVEHLPLPMALRYGTTIKDVEVLIKRDDRDIFVLVSASPTFDENMQIVGAVSVFQDITAQKKVEAKLREDEETIRALFNAMSETICLIDRNDKILAANEAAEIRYGKTDEELIGSNVYSTLPEDLARNRKEKIDAVFETGEPIHFEDDYSGYCFENSIYPIISDGNVVKLAISSKDITERIKAEKELLKSKLEAETARELAECLANTDYLTGVLNRRAFMERCKAEYERSKRNSGMVSLILTDLDYFKRVNDTYGHLAGDVVLQRFTETISSGCRPYDFVGRLGGEEFIICLPDTDHNSAMKVAERMRKAVEEMKITVPDYDQPITITSSFGVVAQPPTNVNSIDSLIGQVDIAMYKAKSSGRNRVCTLAQSL